MKDQSVSAYIEKMDPNLKGIAKRLRTIISKAIPQAEERIWMGVPNYSIDGSAILSIADYSHHINLYFLFGAKLRSKLLEGRGKGMRHIKISTRKDIDEEEITRLAKEAVSLLNRKPK